MKQLELKVTSREVKGSRQAGRLRRSGQIPAVIYGKSGSHPLAIAEADLRLLMRAAHGGAALVNIVDGAGLRVLSILQEVKRNPRTDRFVHVDFREISASDSLTIDIPVHIHGVDSSLGVKSGGLIDIPMHKITVRCLPKDLPSSVELDVSGLDLGQSIHVKELPVLAGVTYMASLDNIVVHCAAPRVESESVAEAVAGPTSEGTEVAAGQTGATPEEAKK
jgi:large subunit ribosomal protein L25